MDASQMPTRYPRTGGADGQAATTAAPGVIRRCTEGDSQCRSLAQTCVSIGIADGRRFVPYPLPARWENWPVEAGVTVERSRPMATDLATLVAIRFALGRYRCRPSRRRSASLARAP